MAYGDMTITYPLFEPRVSQGSTGTNIIYSVTVVSGPTRVGDAGTFEFKVDYVELDVDPTNTYVFHNILADFYLTEGYLDYQGNNTRRIYLQGQLYAPPSRQSTYTAYYQVSAGWVHVELANEQFGRAYDPSPYGTVDGNTVRLWNGSSFTVTPDGNVHETSDYAKINTTGIDHADFSMFASETKWVVRVENASNSPVRDDIVYFSNDILAGLADDDPNKVNPPLSVDAPSNTNRIFLISVTGTVGRRRGSFNGTWTYGVPPTAPDPSGGGGSGVNHGGTATAGVVTGGALRTSQSRVHQGFVRSGKVTNLMGTATGTGGSSSSDGGVTFE